VKYLIAGLGNIGIQYANTRHNIGFLVLDALAEASNILFSPQRYAAKAEFKFKGRTFVLIKPSTYMNLSGKALAYWLKAENIQIENLLVIVDDLALPFGTIRIKAKGSDGGHNGLANINEILNTQNYARMRFGIGNEFKQGEQVDFVLSEWSSEQKTKLPERIETMCQAVKSFGTSGLERTMNFFNNA